MTHPTQQNDQPERRVTQKDIAQKMGISHVAVSKALKGQRGVSAETRTKVLKIAKELGYVQDPMLSILSRYRQSSKSKPLQAELAWINLWKQPHHLREFNEFNLYWEGAQEGARRLGFSLQEFNAAEIPPQRLDRILKTRCIQGILLPPLREPVDDWNHFPWAEFASVRFGRTIPYPETHFVSSAQTANTWLAFNQIRKRGYQRIGFVCEFNTTRFFGAGFAWAQQQCPPHQRIPLLSLSVSEPEQQRRATLAKWIEKNRPDAIFTDHNIMPSMLEKLGYRIPDDIGLATTSLHDTVINAGIDQKPVEIGRAAVRNLIALMAEQSLGVPETCNEILIEGDWVNGSMLPNRS